MAKKLKNKKPEAAAPATEKKSPWEGRLKRMQQYQKENSTDWDENLRLLYGAFNTSDKDNELAYGWGLIKNLETQIYVQNPTMEAEPYDGSKRETGRLVTEICNYDIDQMDLKSIGNTGLADVFTCGYQVVLEDFKSIKRRALVEDEETGEETEEEDLEDQLTEARSIAPRDLLVHPSARKMDLSDADYIAFAWYPTIQELKDDPKFSKNLPEDIDDYREVTPETRHHGRGGSYQPDAPPVAPAEKDPAYKRVCVWECWSKIEKTQVYVLDQTKKEISEPTPWPIDLQIGTRTLYPVTIMAFHPQPKKWYPKPEISLISNQLKAINKIVGQIMKDALTKWRKFATYGGIWTPEQLAKLTDVTIQNAVLEIEGDQIDQLSGGQGHPVPDIDHVIAHIEDPAPNKDLLVVYEMLKDQIQEILGYGPGNRGGLPKTRSAREAVAIKDRQDQRLAKREDAVNDFYRAFGEKHILILQKYLEVERYVRVVSEAQNLVEFKKYGQDDVKGRFNFIVYAGTSGPRSTEAKKAQEVALFQALMPLALKGMIPIEPLVLRLAQAHQWRGVDSLLKNYKPVVKQLAMGLKAMTEGKVQPGQVVELAAAAVQAVLTPEEIQMIAQQGQNGTGGGGEAPSAKQAPGDQLPQGTASGRM
jgi:hypothetical protein